MDDLNTYWLENHGTMCPTQVSGNAPNGKRVYARYRYGQLTVDINGETMFVQTVGDSLDGVMDAEAMKKIAYHVWATYDLIDRMK